MKYEYMLFDESVLRNVDDETRNLNVHGLDGWEVIAVVQMAVQRRVYLKRPVPA